MSMHSVPTFLGMTTAAVVSSALLPAIAQAATFAVESGVTQVSLDFATLETFGITLGGASEDALANGDEVFPVGFDITPDTSFEFSDEGGLTPLGGTIEHAGSVTLNVTDDNNSAADPTAVTLGDFTIGFSAERVSDTASGFFVQDNLDLAGTVLFDIAVPAAGDVTLTEELLILEADLAVADQFAGALSSVFGKPDLRGATIGRAKTTANLTTATASVPESASVLGLTVAIAAFAVSRRSPRA